MKLFVVIVTYNSMKWIDNCLKSIIHSTIKSNIIIIDNNSSDETVRFIKTKYPQITIIESKTNYGFGKANNIGIKLALNKGAEFIYLLNQDAWVEPNTFEGLIKILEINKDYGIVSPMQYNGEGTALDYNFQYLLSPKNSNNLLNDIILNVTNDIYPVKSVMDAHWMINTKEIQEVGGFMPLFFHYGEDNNLIHRMNYHNWKVGIAPNYKGFHDREFREKDLKKSAYDKYIQFLIFSCDINKGKNLIIKNLFKFSFSMLLTPADLKQKLIYL